MNKYITGMGVSLALMATTLSSCDLDTTPTTSLDSDAAFKTTTYAENVLRGAWNMPSMKDRPISLLVFSLYS